MTGRLIPGTTLTALHRQPGTCGTTSRNSSGDTVQFIGGKYTIGDLQLMGAVDRSVFKAAARSVAKVYTLGATYSIGATQLKASYGDLDVNGVGTKFVGLGASYAMSKRTEIYVSLGHRRPDAAAKQTAFGAGVSHSF